MGKLLCQGLVLRFIVYPTPRPLNQTDNGLPAT
jgi:hypothetical protein